jgi:hypothetical protein
MWDFGFLLCDRHLWDNAAKPGDTSLSDEDRKRVANVWDRLWRIGQPREGSARLAVFQSSSKKNAPSVTWREFLKACKLIAKHTRYACQPFDLDLLASESFSCLVLEVWMSELYECAVRRNKPFYAETTTAPWEPRVRRHDSDAWSLAEMLADSAFRRALYRTMLLLDEVFAPDQFTDVNLVLTERAANPQSVASRHWYSTAASAMAESDRKDRVLARLPGRYSMRGDWFLAVARGSRSPRLGERAIDILCSRRANVIRLQTGLGLPVRDLFEPASKRPDATEIRRQEYRTNLIYKKPDGAELPIMYEHLRDLGAHDCVDKMGKPDFYWLWRSTIKHYDLQARIWQKWLCWLVKEWRMWPRPTEPSTGDDQWWDNFCEYDYYLEKDAAESSNSVYVDEELPRWHEFARLCDGVVSALGRATTPLGESSSQHSPH